MTQQPTTALREAYKYPPKKGWKAGPESFSKLWIKLLDGRTLTFHSLDWAGPKSKILSQALGIKRFEKMLTNPEYRHEIAIIYDKETNEKLGTYRQGVKVS